MAMLRASAGSSRSLFDEGAHRLPESADRKVLERCTAMHTALDKLAQLAANYDPRRASIGLGAFESKEISPTAFYEQLRNNFRLTLEPEELGAIVYRFDKNGTGNIHCGDFLVEFWRLRKIERERRQAVALSQLRRHQRTESKFDAVRSARFAQKAQTFSVAESNDARSKEQLRSALRKLRTAAMRWQHRNASVATFEGKNMLVHREIAEFATCREMAPAVFAQQLRINFRVRFTSEEMALLIKRYDTHNSGMVDTSSFLNEFLRTGLAARTKVSAQKRAQTASITTRAAARELASRQRFTAATTNAEAMLCTAPHTMDDLESGLQKIAEKAAFYDASRHNGLAAFEGSHMTLLTFRDQMRNNLGIEFTPGELAALLERYDEEESNEFDCGAFMNDFYRMGRAERTEHDERALDLTRRLNDRSQRKRDALTAKYLETITARMVLPTETNDRQGASQRPFTSSSMARTRYGADFFTNIEAKLNNIDRGNYARGWTYRADRAD